MMSWRGLVGSLLVSATPIRLLGSRGGEQLVAGPLTYVWEGWVGLLLLVVRVLSEFVKNCREELLNQRSQVKRLVYADVEGNSISLVANLTAAQARL